MSLQGKYYDPQTWGSAVSSSYEFDWFWDIWSWGGGDQYGTGPIPMPGPSPSPVISEVPDTWEEYEAQYPEYFEPILETRPGRVPDPYPQDILGDPYDETGSAEEDDEVAHTWWHGLGSQIISGVFGQGDWGAGVAPVTNIGFAPGPTVGPSTPANQAATAAAMQGDCGGMAWSGGVPPKGYKVVNYCGQGVLRKIRRRRRRRMLTASDASDLATIVGIVGKGQMASAMINRTRS